jgi:hypothetical protein
MYGDMNMNAVEEIERERKRERKRRRGNKFKRKLLNMTMEDALCFTHLEVDYQNLWRHKFCSKEAENKIYTYRRFINRL